MGKNIRQHRVIVVLCACLSLVVGACGGSDQGALSGKDPQEIIQLASTGISQNTARFTIDGQYNVDTGGVHGVTPDDLKRLAGPLASSVTFKVQGEQESPQRVAGVFTVESGTPQVVHVVMYEGTTYASLDGTRYRQTDSISGLTGPLGASPDGVNAYLGAPTSLEDRGSEQKDGVTVEHLHGTLDDTSLDKIASRDQLLQLLKQFAHVTGGGLDVYSRQSDGKLDRATLDAKLDVNLDSVLGALGGVSSSAPGSTASKPGGTARLALHLDVHYFDYGAAIRVTRPMPDPTAPTLAPVGGLFSS
ncbi:MAG TPA: hypothetical protein VE219_01495 [Candidatus Sulfotelmatobacter sp.]|nr:hypothetical protein [Candidatus Sulfotelmatobacter sp.]